MDWSETNGVSHATSRGENGSMEHILTAIYGKELYFSHDDLISDFKYELKLKIKYDKEILDPEDVSEYWIAVARIKGSRFLFLFKE